MSANKDYYKVHREMVKDIIVGFTELFEDSEVKIPQEKVEWLISERFNKKQWKYINKLISKEED